MQGRKGKEMSDRENTKDLAALTAKAREGDSGAIADLYELSYDKVYVTVKSMIKDDDTVRMGVEILRGRCCSLPFMMIGYHVVNYMNAVDKGERHDRNQKNQHHGS